MPSVMNAVFDNPKLIAKTIFRSWFKRLGLKVFARAYNVHNSWIQLPSENSVFDARFLEPELGTCWEVLVKPDVMHEVRKLTRQKNTPKGDALTGSHSILGSPEGHQDLETGKAAMAPSGCLQAATPAQSPHNAQDERVAMEPSRIFRQEEWKGPVFLTEGPSPTELHGASKGWLSEVDRIHNEARDAAERAVNPPWLRPSDPATIVENLNSIDRLLDEAEQMSQIGYGDDVDSTWESGQVSAPGAQVAAPEAQNVRRIVVPPEVRGWDEEDD